MDIDVETFYREQDEHMNLSDDDLDEYLTRLSSNRRSNYISSTRTTDSVKSANNDTRISQDHRESGEFDLPSPTPQPSMAPAVSEHGNSQLDILGKLSSSGLGPKEPGSSLNSPAIKRSKHTSHSSNEDDGSKFNETRHFDVGLSSVHHPKTRSISAQPEPVVLDTTTPESQTRAGRLTRAAPRGQSRPPSSDLESTANPLKRKVAPTPLDTRNAKKVTVPAFSDITADISIEDIDSFDTPITRKSPRKRGSPSGLKIAPPVPRPRTRASPRTKKTAKPKDTPSMSPSSPIEDASGFSVSRSRLLPQATILEEPAPAKSGSSKLLMEVRSRVALHSTVRQRNKVVKLGEDAKSMAMSGDESSVIYVSSSSPSTSRASSPTPMKSGGQVKKTQKVPAPVKGKKGGKQRPALQTPVDFANNLIAENAIKPIAKPKHTPFLKDMNIFYYGQEKEWVSDTSRGRMKLILQHGGTLCPTFDPKFVTHIVTDCTAKPPLMKALGIKKFSDIPNHIPTIRWDWVVQGFGRKPTLIRGESRVKMPEFWEHGTFGERLDVGVEKAVRDKGKRKSLAIAPQGSEDVSRISEFTQDKVHKPDDSEDEKDMNEIPLPSSTSKHGHQSGNPSSSRVKLEDSTVNMASDPLAEFYARAKADHENGELEARHGEDDETDLSSVESEDEPTRAPPRKRGYACDTKEVQRTTTVNKDIIDKLQELMDLHKAKPGDEDRWRVYTYSKCIRALKNHPKRIKSLADARLVRGVGAKTASKIMEVVQTGGLRRIDYEKTDDVEAMQLFQGIYGVGPRIATMWAANGCRTLEDLTSGKGGVKLSPAQEIGIRFYDDINLRMPRDEARAIFDLIEPIALSIDPKLSIRIMGSYRRGKPDCGDIDIMITRPTDDGKTHSGVLARLLRDLHCADIVTEDLALPEDPHDLEAIYRGLCHLPGKHSKRRRIDFLTIPWKARGAALLYYTGDDIFNRAMRYKAGNMGYSLNQKGLYKGVVRDPSNRTIKLNTGTVVASETEEEIFKILGVPWHEPHERVKG